MHDKTEVKVKYLEEAILALDDKTSPVHLKQVLGGLQGQLKQYIDAHPNQKLTKQINMLKMAAESLLNKTN